MRMEDLDGPRVQQEMVDQALRDLEWLGLDWDGDMLLQSSGLERLGAAVQRLVQSGQAYPCVCSRADVRAAQSAPQLGDREQRYPGTCRGRYSSVAEAERESGKDAGLRFQVPEGPVTVTDELVGRVAFDVSAEVGDFHIARRDHRPAYQLAVVVDDAHQGVTEVLRGDDLLPSAARQILLQRALGLSTPSWVHVPLVLDEDGRRLAKREDDLSLAELRKGGTDPRAVVRWAAGSAGLDAPDRAQAAELVDAFDLKRLRREPERLARATVQRLREARA